MSGEEDEDGGIGVGVEASRGGCPWRVVASEHLKDGLDVDIASSVVYLSGGGGVEVGGGAGGVEVAGPGIAGITGDRKSVV